MWMQAGAAASRRQEQAKPRGRRLVALDKEADRPRSDVVAGDEEANRLEIVEADERISRPDGNGHRS